MFTTHLHDPNDLRYSFYVVWFDALASLNREYTLLYYTADNTIEMVCSSELFLDFQIFSVYCLIRPD